MKRLAVILDGRIIHVGDWDYALADQFDDEGGVIEGAEPIVTNPFPDGAISGEFEIVESADGRLVLAGDHAVLRAAEYPPIGDQLDALFRAGVFPPEMAERLAAAKAKYPKPL